jgi:hypothetical protein
MIFHRDALKGLLFFSTFRIGFLSAREKMGILSLSEYQVVEKAESQGWRRHEGAARLTPVNFVDQGRATRCEGVVLRYASVSAAERNAEMRNLSTAF